MLPDLQSVSNTQTSLPEFLASCAGDAGSWRVPQDTLLWIALQKHEETENVWVPDVSPCCTAIAGNPLADSQCMAC